MNKLTPFLLLLTLTTVASASQVITEAAWFSKITPQNVHANLMILNMQCPHTNDVNFRELIEFKLDHQGALCAYFQHAQQRLGRWPTFLFKPENIQALWFIDNRVELKITGTPFIKNPL